MKIAVDTNVLSWAVLQDDPQQGVAAARLLREATLMAISLPSLCELVFTSDRLYQIDNSAALNRASGGQAGSPLAAQDTTPSAWSTGPQLIRLARSSSEEAACRSTVNPKVS